MSHHYSFDEECDFDEPFGTLFSQLHETDEMNEGQENDLIHSSSMHRDSNAK